MQTPYDAALRALDREMDVLTQVIAASSARLGEARMLHHALTDRIADEARLATADSGLIGDAYFVRARGERDQRAADAESAAIELDLLRHRAARHYAAIRAVESAAYQFRTEARQADDRQQQAMVDDIAAARFARLRRLQRTTPR